MAITPSDVNACPMLVCNAEESDTRVWLHVVHSAGHKKLLFSPDTDVYHIGLTVISPSECDVYVQLSPLSSVELRLLYLNTLLLALQSDPDLALVSPGLRPWVLQTLFIGTRCDHISFFAGRRKTTMMKHFFQNSWFITGTQEIPGTLADTTPGRVSVGFLSFVRLSVF